MEDSIDELNKTLVYLELKINKQRAILSRMESARMEIINAIAEVMKYEQ
ncbi:MAG: hypothetical protein ACRCX2_14520 [Paraclostridium sp.]